MYTPVHNNMQFLYAIDLSAILVSFTPLTHTVTLRPAVLDDPETGGDSSIVVVAATAAIPTGLIITVVIVAIVIIVCVRLVCECT